MSQSTISDHPVAKARRDVRSNAVNETIRGGGFSRRLLMLSAKLLDWAGDRDGQMLALTAVAAVDDLVEHVKGGKS